MGDSIFVEKLKNGHYLRNIEYPHLVGKVFMIEPDEISEITAVAILQNIIEVLRVLKTLGQLYDSRVIDLSQ